MYLCVCFGRYMKLSFYSIFVNNDHPEKYSWSRHCMINMSVRSLLGIGMGAHYFGIDNDNYFKIKVSLYLYHIIGIPIRYDFIIFT